MALIVAACGAVQPPVSTGDLPSSTTVQLSQTAASPGTWLRVQGAGFRVGEYVEIVVIDAVGSQVDIGRMIADGTGSVEAEVAPGEEARNGVSLIRLNGTQSQRTAAVSINLTGGSDAAPTPGLPQWTVRTDAETTSCEQCLLVHGQTP